MQSGTTKVDETKQAKDFAPATSTTKDKERGISQDDMHSLRCLLCIGLLLDLYK